LFLFLVEGKSNHTTSTYVDFSTKVVFLMRPLKLIQDSIVFYPVRRSSRLTHTQQPCLRLHELLVIIVHLSRKHRDRMCWPI